MIQYFQAVQYDNLTINAVTIESSGRSLQKSKYIDILVFQKINTSQKNEVISCGNVKMPQESMLKTKFL